MCLHNIFRANITFSIKHFVLQEKIRNNFEWVKEDSVISYLCFSPIENKITNLQAKFP